MDTRVLLEIGFSPGEIKVYFALLELGETTIGPLSKKAQVTPAKIYDIIEKLIKKGLVTTIIKSGTKYFQSADPKQIIRLLNEKKNKIDEQKKEFKNLLPQIEIKKKLAEDIQTAQIYQTFEGIRTLYNEILETLKETKEDFVSFTLGGEEYQNKESGYFFQEYDTKRRAAKIKIRLLGHESQRKFLKSITQEDKNIQVKYLQYKMPTGVIIFGDRVATLIWKNIPTAFVIRSKQTAQSYKQFFEDMWNVAKK